LVLALATPVSTAHAQETTPQLSTAPETPGFQPPAFQSPAIDALPAPQPLSPCPMDRLKALLKNRTRDLRSLSRTGALGQCDIRTPATAPTGLVAAAHNRAMTFLINDGPSIWAIAALSVATVALIL
tara:strand:+ start:42007 stop:42387 length:381 start_codon:yes stop_codon:yes gene_type:complete